jgi:serine/threonine-protein kinase HipA
MPSVDMIKVSIWGMDVGLLEWDEKTRTTRFQYFPEFIDTGIELSPIKVPLSDRVYNFSNLNRSDDFQDTFYGLPGFIADSLPEKFGNRLLAKWLADKGLDFDDMSPLERLCYLGSRGMGALEYAPALDEVETPKGELDVHELVSVARQVLQEQNSQAKIVNQLSLSELISVGTSAGGAKAKAVIAWNERTGSVMSGQADLKPGYTHWLMKFDEIDNEEHATSKQIGRIEYAYHQMAVDCGITMMPCRLQEDGDMAHFMTQRFDRTIPSDENKASEKIHVQTFCGIAHADRNPPGEYGYESLFKTARNLGVKQEGLDQIYRRMVFNLLSRNQDDHTRNHAFMLTGENQWDVTPAYDLCFSYKKGNPFISTHQMSCNGKRDDFVLDDLLAAARSGDIKNPKQTIEQVSDVLSYWEDYARDCGIKEASAQAIGNTFRKPLSSSE